MNKVRSSYRSAKAGAIVATLISGTFLIALSFMLIYYPPESLGMKIFGQKNPINSPSNTDVAAEVEEPPPATSETEPENEDRYENVTFTSLKEALLDLEEEGCEIARVKEIQGYSSGAGMLLEYEEFVKIAIKEKMVFLYEVNKYSVLIIPYENTFIIWIPDEIEESSETYTHFERLEIQTGYATSDSKTSSWTITLTVKNAGSLDSLIQYVFLNDVPCQTEKYGLSSPPSQGWGTSIPKTGLQLGENKSTQILVYIKTGYGSLSSGTTINLKLHSQAGMDYIKLIRLP